jgi:hypothetical protein
MSALGSKQTFAGFFWVSALSRLAAVHDQKIEIMTFDYLFHQHGTFA